MMEAIRSSDGRFFQEPHGVIFQTTALLIQNYSLKLFVFLYFSAETSYLDQRGIERLEGGESCITRSFIICTLRQV
jgi:hypothetical protein